MASPLSIDLPPEGEWPEIVHRTNGLVKEWPGVTLSAPFGYGSYVWKVGGKIFASHLDSALGGITVKTPSREDAALMIDLGLGRKPRYFHASWINLPEDQSDEDLRHRIRRSYELIVASLPKKTRETL